MKSKIAFLTLFFFTAVCSCKKDFLETPPTTSVVRQQYVSDVTSSWTFLNGIFADLAQYFYKGPHVFYADLVADNLKPYPSRQNYIRQYNWSQIVSEESRIDAPTTQVNMNSFWVAAYSIIRNSSYLIEKVNDFRSGNEQAVDSILAQAYALRAIAHFELLKVFAQPYNYSSDGSHIGIPYISTSNPSASVVRHSVRQVYQYIIQDLNQSLSNLPEFQVNNELRVSKNTAKGFLARIYLLMGEFNLAKNTARHVLSKIPILTRPEYPVNLFNGKGLQSEALFSLPPQQTPSLIIFTGVYFSNQGLLYFAATKDLVDILNQQPDDVRKSWVNLSGSNWLVSKFPLSVVASVTIAPASYFHTVMRSSEMCLIAAEAYAELNNTDSAHYFLDKIRIRASSTAPLSTATGTALLDSIYKERRKELCFEGARLQDILRQKNGIHRLDAPPAYKDLNYPCNKALAPLPYFEISKTGLKQNEGY